MKKEAMLFAIAFFLFGLAPSAADPFKERMKHKFIENFVYAEVMEELCGSWRLDNAKAMMMMSYLGFDANDIAPGGRYRDEMISHHDYLKPQLERAGKDMACDMAEMMYGPSGQVVENWMKRR